MELVGQVTLASRQVLNNRVGSDDELDGNLVDVQAFMVEDLSHRDLLGSGTGTGTGTFFASKVMTGRTFSPRSSARTLRDQWALIDSPAAAISKRRVKGTPLSPLAD